MSLKKRTASSITHSLLHLSEVLRNLEVRVPLASAERWDNVGLLVGDANQEVTGAVISIDLTAESIETAKRLGYSLILNHHPCIFPKGKGTSHVCAGGSSSLIYEAARAGIAVVSTHTNFDQCALEVPAAVAAAFGFSPIGRLYSGDDAVFTKIVVFVPESHAEKVRNAVTAAGAGKIGRYDTCTFSVLGEGTFRGGENTNPFLGKKGKLERAREVRIETVFPKGMKKRVLAAMREVHPYEEIAYDLYRVEQSPAKVGIVSGLGYGVYGDLPEALSFEAITKKVKKTFGVDGFLMTEPAPKRVKRIGFIAGKGASFVRSAAEVGCDLFITGEAGYHEAREAVNAGLGVMEVGHRESEIFFLQTIEAWCREWKISTKVLNTPVQRIRI